MKDRKSYSVRLLYDINRMYLALQEKYLETRDKEALSEMLQLVRDLSEKYIYAYCQRHRVRKTKEEVEDIQSEVVYRILSRYESKPNWRIKKSLTGYLYFDVLKCIAQEQSREARTQRLEDSALSLEDYTSEGFHNAE